MLADGTPLVLNTGTAVNIRFSGAERRLILLSGEILVATGHDVMTAPRPFDLDRILAALEKSLPVRVQRLTPWWVTVEPA